MNTLSLYSLSPTDRDDVFRVMDLNGDWRWYKCGERYLPGVTTILDVGFPKDSRFHEYLLSVSKDEAKKILESAGDKGARVHDAIQLLEQGQTLSFQQLLPSELSGRPEPLNLKEWLALLAYSQFVSDWKPTLIPCHRTLVGKDYAGTLDDILELTVPESAKRSYPKLVGTTIRVLIDYKTSGGIYPSYGAQVASYYMADHGVKDITHTGILRLGTSHKNGPTSGAGYEVELYTIEETMENYAQFRCAKRFHQSQVNAFDPNELNATLPSSITVSIPTQSAVIAPDLPAHTGESPKSNEDNANMAQAHVGQQLSDARVSKEGVSAGDGRVLPSGLGGHQASGDAVQGSEGNQAPVSVRDPQRRTVRRTKAVPQSSPDNL